GVQQWTNYNNLVGNRASIANSLNIFVRIGYDGTNFTYWASPDGVSWRRLASVAKPFTPSHVGIFMLNTSGNTAYGFFDYFRVKTGTNSSAANAGLFGGRRV
ncbi:MAG TPA: hypothetical protein VHK64_02685, partial [Nocardioidaceae bacterium]|nr:hypothetical protein [Nocardioidaceae bacterium]